ncbi:DUF6515 family protein [Aquimarina sp. RZ0]|uniref:DUF6515 family protein n=1 Tax=Aquimarina sp. RZ0 TaxID=2607730 RepID=UPI0011F1A878|nr:DUF6515 family protein [Aquimarina sp. RZ0]KAA1242630.1 hypothetical protein F0000_24740 [Aquimarina sp. RZ0]
MKTLFKTLTLIISLSGVISSCATAVSARPANKVVISKVHNPKIVTHKNVKYYRKSGVWYIKKNKKYTAVKAPAGVKVTILPTGYRIIKIKGVRYYRYKGVYYKKSGKKYIVVNV